jgi:hypothetical protein
MNEDYASLCTYGGVIESDKCDLINEIKTLLQSSNVMYVDPARIRMGGVPDVYIVAERDPYMGKRVWRLEVWITIKDYTATVLSKDCSDTADVARETRSLKAIVKILKRLYFEQNDVFNNGSFIDIIYARENVEDYSTVAEIIFEVIWMFQSLPEDELSDNDVDSSYVKKAEELEGWKRKIFRAYLEVFIRDGNSLNISREEDCWATISKIAKQLQIKRQKIYKYRKDFYALYQDGLLLRQPYKGPGRKQRECWRYKVSCDFKTAQEILKIYNNDDAYYKAHHV